MKRKAATIIYQNSQLVIRSYQKSDIDELAVLANNLLIARNLADQFPHPYSRSDAVSWVTLTNINLALATNWALVWHNKFVGGIGLRRKIDVYHQTAEIGYWLGQPYWGQGIATQAVTATTNYAFMTDSTLLRLEAGVFSDNPASARVLEKSGYQLEGRLRCAISKNDRVTDLLLYSFIRNDYENCPK